MAAFHPPLGAMNTPDDMSEQGPAAVTVVRARGVAYPALFGIAKIAVFAPPPPAGWTGPWPELGPIAHGE